jgi:hypothetical protein
MKAIITGFALASFVGAFAFPNAVEAASWNPAGSTVRAKWVNENIVRVADEKAQEVPTKKTKVHKAGKKGTAAPAPAAAAGSGKSTAAPTAAASSGKTGSGHPGGSSGGSTPQPAGGARTASGPPGGNGGQQPVQQQVTPDTGSNSLGIGQGIQ